VDASQLFMSLMIGTVLKEKGGEVGWLKQKISVRGVEDV
jgi:hypothetical protein